MCTHTTPDPDDLLFRGLLVTRSAIMLAGVGGRDRSLKTAPRLAGRTAVIPNVRKATVTRGHKHRVWGKLLWGAFTIEVLTRKPLAYVDFFPTGP